MNTQSIKKSEFCDIRGQFHEGVKSLKLSEWLTDSKETDLWCVWVT